MQESIINTDQESVRKRIDAINSRIWSALGNDLNEELRELGHAKQLSRKISYRNGLADTLLNEGWCHSYLGNQKKSFGLFREAGNLYKGCGNTEGLLKSMNATGLLYADHAMYERALGHYRKGLTIARESGNIERISAFLGNIGDLYLKIKRYDDALKYNQDSYELTKKSGNKQHLAINFSDRGSIYLKKGDIDRALTYLFKACDISKKNNNFNDYLESMNLVCEAYLAAGDIDKAESYIRICKQSAREKKIKFQIINACINSGFLNLKKNRLNDSLNDFKEAYDISMKLSYKVMLDTIYKGLYNASKQSGDLESALRFKEEYDAYREENFSSETRNKIGILSTEFRLRQSAQEKEIYEQHHNELKYKNRELKKSHQAIKRISGIGQEIISTLDIEEAVFKLYDSIYKLMDSTIMGLAVYDKEQERVKCRVLIENHEQIQNITVSIHEENSYAATAIRENKDIVVNDISSAADKSNLIYFNSSSDKNAESLICIPLSNKSGVIGILMVQSYEKNSYTEQHLELLKAIGSYLVSTMENSMKHEKVQELNRLLAAEKQELIGANKKIEFLANHDHLTGLPNRRLFMELIDQSIKECRRNNKSFSLFYMDLNRFKEINDIYGHDTGDQVLKYASRVFVETLREVDIVARLGGDEFIILCPDMKEKKDCITIASKIIENLGKKTSILDNQSGISVSIGMSVFPDDSDERPELIKKADSAMYIAKKTDTCDYFFYHDMEHVSD